MSKISNQQPVLLYNPTNKESNETSFRAISGSHADEDVCSSGSFRKFIRRQRNEVSGKEKLKERTEPIQFMTQRKLQNLRLDLNT